MSPSLILTIKDLGIKTEIKQGSSITFGRAGHGADIEIDDSTISRTHAELSYSSQGLRVMDPGSKNGVYVNNVLIPKNQPMDVNVGDRLVIGPYQIEFEFAAEKKRTDSLLKQLLTEKNRITIGRNSDNDIVLSDPTVSRHHAAISVESGKYWVEDLDSTNGTYLNDVLVKTRTEFGEQDTLLISLHAFQLNKAQKDLRSESAIIAQGIEKKYPNGYVGLKQMSAEIPNSHFVALMGPSGCGKSTLLKALNGDNPASSGQVYIHGLLLNMHYNFLKRKIGYVPQDDIVHRELTVERTLYFAAKLRLPESTSDAELEVRIDKVLTSLNINDPKIRKTQIKDLSGGQRKRISIAVELLNQPTILFLDEPTSPLDPETIDEFLKCIRQLVKEGTTVVMVTHKPEDLKYVDRVIFLAANGYLSFYGEKEDFLKHFDADNIIEIYAKLNKPKNALPYYNQLLKNEQTPELEDEAVFNKSTQKESFWLQLYWLVLRYLNIKINDRSNLVLLVAQPVIISVLVIFIFKNLELGVMFLMAIAAIWFGVSNAAKEIVGELPIYLRERMFNLKINTYILSKLAVLSLIAFIQVLIFVTIIYQNYKNYNTGEMPEIYLQSFGTSVWFMFYISIAATAMGLLLSSLFDNTERVMTVVPIALMPQIMLAGVISKIEHIGVELLSFLTLGRWGTEGLARIQDLNSEGLDPLGPVASIVTHVPKMTSDTVNVGSCNCISVIPDENQLMAAKKEALALLNFYDPELNLIGGAFDNLVSNILMIAVISAIFFGMTYLALKKKDRL
jgi:ABC-type multidrug transport system ATPase subunit